MKLRGWMTACALSAAGVVGLASSSSFAQVTGKVTLKGDAPEREPVNMAAVAQCAELHADPVLDETVVVGDDKELANVVVYVKSADGSALEGEVPEEPAVLDQEGCQYKPHVVALMVGQEIYVKNSDPFLHNVHALPIDNEGFNKGQPNIDNDPGMKVKPMTVPEKFPVKCDVHPWMLCHFVVLEHPYFATTAEDGTFTIPTEKLADGTYTLVFWHEKLGEVEKEGVEIKDGKAEEEVEFEFEPQAAADAPEQNVRLASAVLVADEAGGENGTCKLGGECCETTKKAKAAKAAKAVADAE